MCAYSVLSIAKIVIGLYIIVHSFVLPSIVLYAFLNVILLQRPSGHFGKRVGVLLYCIIYGEEVGRLVHAKQTNNSQWPNTDTYTYCSWQPQTAKPRG